MLKNYNITTVKLGSEVSSWIGSWNQKLSTVESSPRLYGFQSIKCFRVLKHTSKAMQEDGIKREG